MKLSFLNIAVTVVFISCVAFPQEREVENCLKKIEQGKSDSAKIVLKGLLKKYPDSPSALFLDGVLTTDGKDALTKYLLLVDKYPDSKYADAALFRIYSYYYALGLYSNADRYLQKLKTSYPESRYIKTADPNFQNKSDIPSKNIFTHTIQAGAFIDKDNAISLCAELDELGYETNMKERSLGGTSLYVIYVGKFQSEAEAEEVLAKINKDYKLEGRVVALKN
jgi:tetratricopeptide (TPR) repeat protein